jgi:hypothetical protein
MAIREALVQLQLDLREYDLGCGFVKRVVLDSSRPKIGFARRKPRLAAPLAPRGNNVAIHLVNVIAGRRCPVPAATR